ncbi:MAG: hypothetical protein OXE78_00145, partial [Gammaproteobacteria bacterium]|nr:hypothetical protein [Gammaproteobacteria bacterium]
KIEIHYQVNGENQAIASNRLTMVAILERAGKPASINVDDLSSYYLENVVTGKCYDDLDAEVIVCEGDRFIAVHSGKTPIA